MSMVADSAPELDGVKMTLMVHCENSGREPVTVLVSPQVLDCAKSSGFEPVKVMAMLLRVELVLLVSVTAWDELDVPVP